MVELPYELLRPIFQDVYATENLISHPPSDFIFSNLHSRLNIYRCLASVSRSWRLNARDVFFEDLQVHTVEALRGLIKIFRNDRQLATAVMRLDFSFAQFRCSASVPRRPRALAPEAAPTERIPAPASQSPLDSLISTTTTTNSTPDWKTIHRRDTLRYKPSTLAQARHWSLWQADVADLLSMCSSTSTVNISFTSSRSYNTALILSPDLVRHWFPPPDLTNDRIAEGLLKSANLRFLNLVNPTPLEVFSSAFGEWKRLKILSVTLTRSFQELPDTTFIPPKSLYALRFHDRSPGKYSWPLSSDMGKCTNLQVLDLGLYSRNVTTMKAIAFLCHTYQHTLRTLILRAFSGHEENGSFQDVFQSQPPLHFENLERLHLPNATYDTSLFGVFKAAKLKTVEVGWLTIEPVPGTREEKWSRCLNHPCLQALSQLIINTQDPDPLRSQALTSVCERLGIQLRTGYSMVGSRGDSSDVFDIDFEENVHNSF